MGWSCRVEANWVLDAWSQKCINQTGQQNRFDANGESYFFETSRTEHDDGAITGTIWRFLPNDRCRRSGSFRIEGNGEVTRGPKFFKDCTPTQEEIQKRYEDTYGKPTLEWLGSQGFQEATA